jgi:hypothetical protein
MYMVPISPRNRHVPFGFVLIIKLAAFMEPVGDLHENLALVPELRDLICSIGVTGASEERREGIEAW